MHFEPSQYWPDAHPLAPVEVVVLEEVDEDEDEEDDEDEDDAAQ